MSRKTFINLPVKDLQRSIAFYTKLGFDFDPQFTDDNAACMKLSQDSFVMLLKNDFFRRFTKKDIVDASTRTEVIVAIDAKSRDEVDSLVDMALKSGGAVSMEPMTEGMYGNSFADPDGHLWEVIYMEEPVAA